MVKMPISKLRPGMKLAKDIVLDDGRLLLLAGFAIKPLYIRKLEAFNIREVYVEEGPYEATEEFEEERIYTHAAEVMKNMFSLARKNEASDLSTVKNTVEEILTGIIENENVMLQLTGIKDMDNYTFLHSVDVCIYSIIMGKKLGYGKDLLMSLGLGAILHDIGKCRIPVFMLQKPDKLTEEEFDSMRLHTVYGYEIIKNMYRLSDKVANIAFQHHEKWDGSGYPKGLTRDAIDQMARIVALTDVYDALTSDRVYKKKVLPHIAAEYIKRNSGILFDPFIVDLFINSITVYTKGTLVLLSSGELGSVVCPGNAYGKRQRISVFSRKSGPPVFQPYLIDLNEKKDLEIVEVFI